MEQIRLHFEAAIAILKATYPVPYPEDVIVSVVQAQGIVLQTVDLGIAAYNNGDMTKEEYSQMREFRDYALAYLEFARRLMVEYPNQPCEFGEANDAIHTAVKFLKKALKVISSCECSSSSSCDSSSSACSTSCGCSDSSSCDSSSSGCSTSCECSDSSSSGCSTSSSSSGCSTSSSSSGCSTSSSSSGCSTSSCSSGCSTSSCSSGCSTSSCGSSSSGCSDSSSSSCSSTDSSVSCGCN